MARATVELDFFSMEKESSITDYPLLPLFSPTSRLCCCSEKGPKITSLTIFYDGMVAVFDVTKDEAENILKFAEKTKIMNAFAPKKQLFVETLSGDLSLARRNSLLRFLEKRKERLTMVSPYGFPQSSGNKNQHKI